MSPPPFTQSTQARLWRRAKLGILQAGRLARWASESHNYGRPQIASTLGLNLQHRISVAVDGAQSHPILEAGKGSNLAIAAAHFDGRRIGPDASFSFWRILGRPSKGRGFLPGTEVRDGCIVPALGGGLCLLSGVLFQLAAELDWRIIERHGHTVQGQNPISLDATIFWPQVDLRFAPRSGDSVLRVRVKEGVLTVEAHGPGVSTPVRVWREPEPAQNNNQNNNARIASRVVRINSKGRVELLGVDSKRLPPAGETNVLKRNCLTCEETHCSAREHLLRVVR